jgi:predicted TIM-barrel fold metal-dependent hydrolase
MMRIIDADTHVIETERTWHYMDESDAKVQPLELTGANGRRFLAIDGRIRPAAAQEVRPESRSEVISGRNRTTEASRTMEDVDARLRHMDELGIDTQVLYPTIFLSQVTGRPETEVALCRSYNRWLADIWQLGEGRLRWVTVLPLLTMDEALAQLRWAKDHGAAGVFMQGFEGQRIISDPYFFPLYEEAQDLDLAMCVHGGNHSPAYRDLAGSDQFVGAKMPAIGACHSLLVQGVPDRFPRLRWGFIEASAMWLPWLVTDLRRRLERTRPELLKENLLRDNRMYVTCQTDEDIPYMIQYVGEDTLVMGTDYGHADTSAELEALRTLATDSDLPAQVVQKILEDNPKALYAL